MSKFRNAIRNAKIISAVSGAVGGEINGDASFDATADCAPPPPIHIFVFCDSIGLGKCSEYFRKTRSDGNEYVFEAIFSPVHGVPRF